MGGGVLEEKKGSWGEDLGTFRASGARLALFLEGQHMCGPHGTSKTGAVSS